jgi:hypothetical protein
MKQVIHNFKRRVKDVAFFKVVFVFNLEDPILRIKYLANFHFSLFFEKSLV